jgi:hypothetical protein
MSFQDSMQEYHTQLQKGSIQKAYRMLMDYMLELRSHFAGKYKDFTVSGSLYFGFMDMTYFAATPASLKERGLKIAIVYLHEANRFEVWLAAVNKQVQSKYWQFFKDSSWSKYRLVPTVDGADSILEETLAENPDFADLPRLTGQIESGTLAFIKEVEMYLAKNMS